MRVLSILDREELKSGVKVGTKPLSNAVVSVLPPDTDSGVQMLSATEKPDVTYSDIGGLDVQKQEIREAIELPLSHPELYK